VVTVLKHRIALVVLVGVLVIPVLTSSLGGIGQLLSCTAEIEQPFSIAENSEDQPQLTSSVQLSRDDDEFAAFEGTQDAIAFCDGVTAELSATPIDDERVALNLTITNGSELPWQGSIGVVADGADITVDVTRPVGSVPAGESRTATLELRVPSGQTEFSGTVLLGP
jgi:hypothetical protein